MEVIVSLHAYKVNFLLKTPQNAGNTLSELPKIQHFLGGMLPDPSIEAQTFGGRHGCHRFL